MNRRMPSENNKKTVLGLLAKFTPKLYAPIPIPFELIRATFHFIQLQPLFDPVLQKHFMFPMSIASKSRTTLNGNFLVLFAGQT